MSFSNSAVAQILFLAVLLCSSLAAQDLRQERFMSEAREAFQGIYNLDYQKSYDELLELRQKHPQHPAPPLYLATVKWLAELFQRQNLDLDLFLAPGYFAEEG
ncbi:MAG TPA: hypothetical protein VLV83_23775, partial [Acidobacteriota bacterium]|nr:hypothetical protein [Acidobacteriota bacterium]